jgi:hypothetical protein
LKRHILVVGERVGSTSADTAKSIDVIPEMVPSITAVAEMSARRPDWATNRIDVLCESKYPTPH